MHQLVIRDLEIHNRADLRQVLHSLIGVHGGTTRGDNAVLRIDLAENLVLDLDETLRAARIDDLLQRLVALVLDDDVGVDEVLRHDFRQHDAQRGFTRAGHADKNNVVLLRHGKPSLIGHVRPNCIMPAHASRQR